MLSHRREGIARATYRSFEKELASYPIRSVTFQTGVFSRSTSWFGKSLGLVEDEDRNLARADRTSYALDSRSDVKVVCDPYYLDEMPNSTTKPFLMQRKHLK